MTSVRDAWLREIHEASDEIESGIADFDAAKGMLSAYQRIVTQLAKLLVDRSSGATPLLLRAFPDAGFERLTPPRTTADGRPVGGVHVHEDKDGKRSVSIGWDFRGSVGVGGGIRHQLEVVAEDLVPVEDWLNDWVHTPTIRLGELIREVRNKRASHSDDDRGPLQTELDEWTSVANGVRVEYSRIIIVSIGEYVAKRVRKLLLDDAS